MPHAIIKMYPGGSEPVKNRLTGQIVEDVTSIANCKEDGSGRPQSPPSTAAP